MVIMNNIRENLSFNVQYMFSIISVCLILRLASLLQFNETIGPIFKIVGKLQGDFLNYFLIYTILAIMFTLVGNLNFMLYLSEYDGFFLSIIKVINISIGNFKILEYKSYLAQTDLKVVEIILTLSIAVTYFVVLSNLLIAMLANTYNIFNDRSNGLYLSKLLIVRDELLSDHTFGAFLAGIPPLNFLQVPFIPFAMSKSRRDPTMMLLNKRLTQLQYIAFMLILFAYFQIASFLLIPFAYINGIVDKIKGLGGEGGSNLKMRNLIAFIVFGFPILLLNMINDAVYFWRFNFMHKSQMMKIIVPVEYKGIRHRIIKGVANFCSKYNQNKIKTVTA